MSDQPNKNGEKVERNPDGTIKSGVLNPAGRPKGSISIKDRIRQHLQEDPDRLEELVDFYMKNEQPVMRKLLWEMLEGKPQQQVDMEVSMPKPIIDVFSNNSDTEDKETEEED